MVVKRLTERVHLPFAGSRVNRAAGTISNVLICGTTSLNNREYPVHVLRRDYARYEGRPVNCDHGREATVDRRFGWFEDVKPGPDGRPRGTLHLLKSHPMYARLMEAAERNPSLYGFSHVAMCRTKPGTGGREVVEAIEHVESIDLVAEPATTRGLFEGTGMRTLRNWFESLAARRNNRALLRVAEEMPPQEGDMPVDAPGIGADDSGDGDADAVGEAIKSAGNAIWSKVCDGSLDVGTALGRLKKLAAVLDKAQDALGDDPDTGGAASESRRRPSGTPPTDGKAFAEWLGHEGSGTPASAKAFAEQLNRADEDEIAGRPLFTGSGVGTSVSTAFPDRR